MATLITTKITKDTLKMLRLIAANTNEKQYQVLERLLKAELERINDENKILSAKNQSTFS